MTNKLKDILARQREIFDERFPQEDKSFLQSCQQEILEGVGEMIKGMEKSPYNQHVGNDTERAYDMGKSNGYNQALSDLEEKLKEVFSSEEKPPSCKHEENTFGVCRHCPVRLSKFDCEHEWVEEPDTNDSHCEKCWEPRGEIKEASKEI